MESRHFTRLQRYIVRFTIDEQDAKETINALSRVNWEKLYKDSTPAPRKQKLTQEQKQERSEELRQLPYEEYLKTQYWLARRAFAIKRARERCQVCNASDVLLNVHHRTYARLGCELNSDIIVLCEKCHKIFHESGMLAK